MFFQRKKFFNAGADGRLPTINTGSLPEEFILADVDRATSENGRIIIESGETALLLPADQWVVIGRGHHCLTIRKRRVEQ